MFNMVFMCDMDTRHSLLVSMCQRCASDVPHMLTSVHRILSVTKCSAILILCRYISVIK